MPTNGARVDEGQCPQGNELDAIESLRQENAALRAALRARDDFIAVAAHELRNPITPLIAQISLLRKSARLAGSVIPDRIAQGIERLDLIIRRYMRRTTTLLDISRLTSGNFRLDPTMIDASAVVYDVAADFKLHAEAAGAGLVISIEDGIVGLLDRTAVEEIAENLISNAIKYGGGKPIDVTLTGDAAAICLQVRDRGPGISADDRGRIFEQFERLVAGRNASGFGLGLWVVGQLTAALGGTIVVESNLGQGSTFTVRLPLQTTEGQG